MMWRCVICCVFVALTLKALLSHIHLAHSHSPDFRVICGIDGCTKEYRVYNSFWYHIKRTHSQHLTTTRSRRTDSQLQSEGHSGRLKSVEGNRGTRTSDHFGNFDTGLSVYSGFTSEGTSVASDQAPQDTDVEIATELPLFPEPSSAPSVSQTENGQETTMDTSACHHLEDGNIARHATAFLLSAKEKHQLSESSLNAIVAGVQQCQGMVINSLKERLRTVFQSNSGSQLEKEAMAVLDTFKDPFASLSTTHMRESALNEHFNVVGSEEVKIGQKACRVKRKGSSVLSINDVSFQYIPLVKSLEQFLSHPKILSMIDDGPQTSREGFLYDIVDGDILRFHPLFSVKPHALQIILYTDEIEMCNPLGSCAAKNKLLMVYYTLGNINPKYRSKLSAIRLLAIANSNDLSDVGLDAVLRRIQEDLVLLYNGVKIQTVDGEREIYGAVISVCGDTLAQHELCGFKEGVGFAYSKCRHCECTFEDMQNHFNEDVFVKRSLDIHIRQCNEIEKASTDFLRNSLSTTYGINRKSMLIDFPGFDLIQQTPHDIMHVILEGIAQLEVKCVLKHLVLSGQIDLDRFNSDILGFPYALTDVRDKPCPITYATLASNDNKIKQFQGRCLFCLKSCHFCLVLLKETRLLNFFLN